MEHHSNHISWLETIAEVVVFYDLDHLRRLLRVYRDRKVKIAAVTACSNVTGIHTPYREIAALMHDCGGLCFVDFACAAPYVEIDMSGLDAIYFSCHKFLGGPGTPGVLVFNGQLYGEQQVPDQPGGGTVYYTNPWGGRAYVSDIEQREDGGTPPILQGIKAAMCIRLKEEMGVANILAREEELKDILLSRLLGIDGVEVLESSVTERLGIVSFIVRDMHYYEVVRLLNDRFGIQARGGCSCAGTYGHVLLNIDRNRSSEILRSIEAGDPDSKPGWVRLSVHPSMTDAEIDYIADAVELTVGALTGV
jgi:selenocysteine lyase/cysteine desulfurase